MSQDLFAAFVGTDDNQQYGHTTNLTAHNGLALNNHAAQTSDVGEDDWGDFEAADNEQPTTGPKKVVAISSSRHHYILEDLGPSLNILSVAAPSKEQEKPSQAYDQQWDTFEPHKPKASPAFATGSDVLFDATEADDENNFGAFGDFDDFQGAAQEAQKTPEVDLLGLDDEVIERPKKQHPKTTSNVKSSEIKFGSIKRTINTDSETKEAQATEDDNEGWDDFSAWDNDGVDKPTATKPDRALEAAPNLSSLLSSKQQKMSDQTVPPTNVPPPAVLLSIFPSIFETVEKELLKPAAAQSMSARQQIYTQPKTIDYLQEYTSILMVLARITVGRKLRWKRDNILAQSMRIGSAAGGRVSGMKVTSIDKSEVKKEDGEVAEVLAAWNAQAGRVRTAVHEARKVRSEVGVVPDIKDVMSVKTIKEIDGGVPSVRPCALCGLKRDERLAKVDVDVLDSFGEWWIDTTSMHRVCRDFWAEYEAALRQR